MKREKESTGDSLSANLMIEKLLLLLVYLALSHTV
jgi:hypothetical protein